MPNDPTDPLSRSMIGRSALRQGILSEAELAEFRRAAGAEGGTLSLIEYLLERKGLTPAQVADLLRSKADNAENAGGAEVADPVPEPGGGFAAPLHGTGQGTPQEAASGDEPVWIEPAGSFSAGSAPPAPSGVVSADDEPVLIEPAPGGPAGMSPPPASAPVTHLQFGYLAMRLGYVTREQLAVALDTQRFLHKGGKPARIGEILVSQGVLQARQILSLLRLQGKTLLRCAGCGSRFNAEHYDPAHSPPCRRCGGTLRPAEAGDVADVPSAQGTFTNLRAVSAVAPARLRSPASRPAAESGGGAGTSVGPLAPEDVPSPRSGAARPAPERGGDPAVSAPGAGRASSRRLPAVPGPAGTSESLRVVRPSDAPTLPPAHPATPSSSHYVYKDYASRSGSDDDPRWFWPACAAALFVAVVGGWTLSLLGVGDAGRENGESENSSTPLTAGRGTGEPGNRRVGASGPQELKPSDVSTLRPSDVQTTRRSDAPTPGRSDVPAPPPDPGVPVPPSVSAPAATPAAAAPPVPDGGGAGAAAIPDDPSPPTGEPPSEPPIPPPDRAEIVRRVGRISDPEADGMEDEVIRFGVERQEGADGGSVSIFGYVPVKVPDGALLEVEFHSGFGENSGSSVHVHVCEVRGAAFAGRFSVADVHDLGAADRVTVRFGDEQPSDIASTFAPGLKRLRGESEMRLEDPVRFCREVNRTAEELLKPLAEARAVWPGLCALAARMSGYELKKPEWDAWKAEHPPEVLRETLSGSTAPAEPHRYVPRFTADLQRLIRTLDSLYVGIAFHLKDKVEPPFDESATGAGILLGEGTVAMPDRLAETLLDDVGRWYRRSAAQVLDDIRRESSASGRIPSGAEPTIDALEGLYFEFAGKEGLAAGGGRAVGMREIFEGLRRLIRAVRDGGDRREILRDLQNRLKRAG